MPRKQRAYTRRLRDVPAPCLIYGGASRKINAQSTQQHSSVIGRTPLEVQDRSGKDEVAEGRSLDSTATQSGWEIVRKATAHGARNKWLGYFGG